MTRIDDQKLRALLLGVEKPARYTGGEFGSVRKDALLKVAVSYPDLYEIGMSNQAVRILLSHLNRIEGVQAERVFAPALDFERALRAHGLPLFSLESRLPLSSFDLIAFSVGYELNATTVLQILDSGGVPLRTAERTDAHPIVIGGGPGLTNPVPFLRFFDFAYVGEAEGWINDMFTTLVRRKRAGEGRAALLDTLASSDALASASRPAAIRAVWTGFGGPETDLRYPVSSLKTAQDHGLVEIMRGCPNGCRFCNAGYYYRPFRLKPAERVFSEACGLVFDRGYREISLSSLSTGDYPGIGNLVRRCNRDLANLGTSFSLPSLRIDSLALELFRDINEVRKSGLTFAIETPDEDAQRGLNKQAPLDKTIALLHEAKSLGWRQAKFYFMLGLPGYTDRDETEPIIACLSRIRRETGLSLHVNVGTFVPKPHTPFQWSAQLSEAESHRRIGVLRSRLPRHSFKVSFHLPFQSFLEGLIARGDGRAGEIIERAFRAGARFDAWEEHIDVDLWKTILAEAGWDVAREVCREKDPAERFPWSDIDLGVAEAALKREAERGARGELTGPCAPDCDLPCGVCGRGMTAGVMPNAGEAAISPEHQLRIKESREFIARNERHPVLFSFAKTGDAVFLSHLNIMTVFERALLRAGYYCRFTEGFNPKPVMEFANPLPLGFASRAEAASVELYHFDDEAGFVRRMNEALPEGLAIIRARRLTVWKPGEKKRSLMSVCAGGDYLIRFVHEPATTDFADDPEVMFVRYKSASRELIVRYAGKVPQAHSLKKYLVRVCGGEDFLQRCRPLRLMTLAKDEQGKVNSLFKVY
jgi:radical SAM-linked protein